MKHFEIISDFLQQEILDDFTKKNIENYNPDLKWVWFPNSVTGAEGEDDGQFVNIIMAIDSNRTQYLVDENFAFLGKEVENKIEKYLNKKIFCQRIKMNAIQKGFSSKYIKHLDSHKQQFSLLLYLTDSDGPTIFNIDGVEKKIECKQNTAVLFDSTIEHYAIRQTDCKLRISLNVLFEVL